MYFQIFGFYSISSSLKYLFTYVDYFSTELSHDVFVLLTLNFGITGWFNVMQILFWEESLLDMCMAYFLE